MSDEPTPGEIGRRLDQFEKRFGDALTEMKTFFHQTMVEMKTEISNGETSAHRRMDGLEERLRVVEQRPVITPKSMWTGIGALAGVLAALCAVLAIILTIALR